jgi:hypothetical protein
MTTALVFLLTLFGLASFFILGAVLAAKRPLPEYERDTERGFGERSKGAKERVATLLNAATH